jgi:pyruvate,orthophosphate dikinase
MGGAFRGVAAFGEEQARQLRSAIDPDDASIDGVLLILENPVPDEIPLILSVDGLLAARGGSTAHAAVAVNGIDDRPYSAVLGVSQMKVEDGHATIFDPCGEVHCTIHTGDVVSIHGQTGEVFIGSREVYA